MESQRNRTRAVSPAVRSPGVPRLCPESATRRPARVLHHVLSCPSRGTPLRRLRVQPDAREEAARGLPSGLARLPPGRRLPRLRCHVRPRHAPPAPHGTSAPSPSRAPGHSAAPSPPPQRHGPPPSFRAARPRSRTHPRHEGRAPPCPHAHSEFPHPARQTARTQLLRTLREESLYAASIRVTPSRAADSVRWHLRGGPGLPVREMSAATDCRPEIRRIE